MQAPDLVPSRMVWLRVLDPVGRWRMLYGFESDPGLFGFRVPPGEQKLQFGLKSRTPSLGCGHGIPPRQDRPETEPYVAWLVERRTVHAVRGRTLHVPWRPRPESSMCWLFEAPSPHGAASAPSNVEVTRLDPLDPKKRRVLDRNPTLGSLAWGQAAWYAPPLPSGRHVFRFEAKGYEPVIREVWLAVHQNRLVRIRLHRAVSPKVPPQLEEPYRCGRAQR